MGNYDFTFSWHSPYAHAVRLLERMPAHAGIVLDLGCGNGAIADPLRERGHEYVGCDLDKRSVDSVRQRGFEAHELDLGAQAELTERVLSIVDGRPVAAVTLLDTIEHLPDTADFLSVLRETLLALGRPMLVLSVPNVAHYDLGAKLLMGRWDYTPTGLLDITHVSFFTENRLTDELARCGWVETARDDYLLLRSDQHFPAEHPALVDGSPLSMLLRHLRGQADRNSTVNQFIRCYALSDLVGPARPSDPAATPFLSVLVRTQGNRRSNLLEALTCLAAQTDVDFEVLLLVHTTTSGVVDHVRRMVDSFDDSFRVRARVIEVMSGGRARPLNVGLAEARGRYLAFLDDDDYVTGDWVETFHKGADEWPGKIVRSVCVERRIESLNGKGYVAEWQPLGPLEGRYGEEFDLLEHLNENRSPIHSFAIPLTALRSLGLQFDESLPVVEDWDVLIRVASLTGVHDTRRRTAIYHRWANGDSSQASIDLSVWSAAREVVLHRLDSLPLLLPPGSASRIAASCFRSADPASTAAPVVTREPEPDLAVAVAERRPAEEQERLRAELAAARRELQEFQRSEFWRATRPLRSLTEFARRRLRSL